MPVSVAARIFSRSGMVSFAMASRSPDSTVLNGSTFFSSGLAFTTCRDAFQAIHHLRIHRMLDPERAVLVESGDALLGRHEFRASLIRGGLHEVDDRLLGGPVVPRGQRVTRCCGLRLRGRGQERSRHGRKRRQCRQEGTAVDTQGRSGCFHGAPVPVSYFSLLSSCLVI